MLFNLALFTLASTSVTGSPIHILDRRQDVSSSSSSSASSSESMTPTPTSDASSASSSGSAVPTDIQSAASSFQSSAPEPSGAASGPGAASERYPFTCPEPYLLTYAFNQISFDQSVDELLPIVNWTSPLYVQAQESSGNSTSAGATRTLKFYGDLTQEELLDYYSFNQTEDGGFLNQIWNLTNGPLQYSDDPSLELLNYTTQLQLYANKTDEGSSTVKLFSNLCVNDQTLGYTSFSAYLGTLLSNMRIAAANSAQVPGSPTSGAQSSSGMSSSGSAVPSSAMSSGGSSGGAGGAPVPVPTGSDASSGAASASSGGSGAASSTMASGASSGASSGGAGGAPVPAPTGSDGSSGAASASSTESNGASSTASSGAAAGGGAGASSEASSTASDASSTASDAASSASSTASDAAGGASSSASDGAGGASSSAESGASDASSAAPTSSSSSGGGGGGVAGGAGGNGSSSSEPSSTSSDASSTSSGDSGSAASSTATTAVSGSDKALTLVSPNQVQTCGKSTIQYSGGNAPYFITAVAAESGVPLNEIPIQSTSGSYDWTAAIRSGTKVVLKLSDRNGNTVKSDPFTVESGSSTDCLGST